MHAGTTLHSFAISLRFVAGSLNLVQTLVAAVAVLSLRVVHSFEECVIGGKCERG